MNNQTDEFILTQEEIHLLDEIRIAKECGIDVKALLEEAMQYSERLHSNDTEG